MNPAGNSFRTTRWRQASTSDASSAGAQASSVADFLYAADPAAAAVGHRHFLPVAASVNAVVAVAPAESAAARPWKIADLAKTYVAA